jgi:pyruvate/2-oxoglutarate dehydrogenase complex dihydrolipoamide dehydrogenase (E3) component
LFDSGCVQHGGYYGPGEGRFVRDTTDETVNVSPLDEPNRRLLEHVRPAGWPTPAGDDYDLVVIGGGTAGLVTAVGAAGLGARVALIERALLGGDCLNVGCVPSKALLRSARAAREVRRGAALGIAATAHVDFGAVMARMRARRADIAPHDSAARLTAAGVSVFLGSAAFEDARHVSVNGRRLRFRRAVIASGGRPTAPDVPGLAETGYFTNETVFNLTELPRRLLVVGAGPIGCELAQAFALFGSAVTMVDVAPRVLPREDPDAGAIVRRSLEADGVRVETGITLERVQRGHDGIRTTWKKGEERYETVADAVLVAAGRAPNVEGLNLDAAGIRAGRQGIDVDDRLRSSNPRVYAAGDVASPYQFTHAADAAARIVIQNALFFGRRRASALVIPWCTYTSPELAHVGLTAEQARHRNLPTITIPLDEIDRAVVDDETDGFVRVHSERGRIRGCTIVAPHAGDLIGHVSHVMRSGGRLGDLSGTVFPYPTYAEALRKAGDAYRRELLTSMTRRWLRRYFAVWRRWT